ncbi:hypothetical protein SO802_000431 [Lithocarpus litseifolius]|uniref:Myb/SANT-like domain-containing protein n=1 Tax=Lithocarpus litseifolius TaxID=425828 RepID=A0AAW2DRZ0_9ROSI
MDNPSLLAAIMGAATFIITLGVVLLKGLRSRRVMPREPHVNREYEKDTYMNDILCRGDMRCLHHIRMRPIAFYALCKILSENNLLQETIHMSIKEQVLIFLHTIGHDVRFRVVGGRFYRSVETVHRYFRHVLRAVLQLYKHMIREPDKDTPLEIRNSSRFNSNLKDCVGAIDGTHVRAFVPIQIQGRFRGRKDGTTQNVLAAATVDLKFTYVLADEALHGNKQSNTFKHASYAKVAEAITEKFMTECTPKHVEHRFKTLKTNWNTIALLLNKKSGFGWNDDLKMITCDRTVYDKEVKAHPNHAQFLNKKIEMFDEMALVVGKDMAIVGFSKGVGDIGVESLDDSPPLVDADVDDISKKKQVDPSHVTYPYNLVRLLLQ